MNNDNISPLRQRMIEDMTVRRFGPKTQSFYVRVVRDFAVFLGSAPDRATAEDLRRYQLHLTPAGATTSSINRPARHGHRQNLAGSREQERARQNWSRTGPV